VVEIEQHQTNSELEDGMRRGIRSWVSEPGRWLQPIGSVIAAAARSPDLSGYAERVTHAVVAPTHPNIMLMRSLPGVPAVGTYAGTGP
jgi:hypothetical protein